MPFGTCGAPLLQLLLSACATTEPNLGELEAPNPRIANLQRAAQYPWRTTTVVLCEKHPTNGLSWRKGSITLSIMTGSSFAMSQEDVLSPRRVRLPQPWQA
jgi:hypothetical protein